MQSNLPGIDLSIVDDLRSIISKCDTILTNLEDLRFVGKDCWNEVDAIKKEGCMVSKKLLLKLPLLAPRVVDLTDAGPGVSTKERVVLYRLSQMR